ncbi:hypothetical protein QO001_005869 [Methylobacterium brachiatum]|uniref:Uncharacterized protein n=1 Tax=Methylobacterium brachiatum TaxID=269660 RepID=A0AAJ1TTJ9_9HYPH|nr:hypothetical protein [Methylobacterium brachiatum]
MLAEFIREREQIDATLQISGGATLEAQRGFER